MLCLSSLLPRGVGAAAVPQVSPQVTRVASRARAQVGRMLTGVGCAAARGSIAAGAEPQSQWGEAAAASVSC